jgi:hypothetical protein
MVVSTGDELPGRPTDPEDPAMCDHVVLTNLEHVLRNKIHLALKHGHITLEYVEATDKSGARVYNQVCEAEAMRKAQDEVRDRWGLVYGEPVLVIMCKVYQDGTAITNRISVTPVILHLATLTGKVDKKLDYDIRLGALGYIRDDTLSRTSK